MKYAASLLLSCAALVFSATSCSKDSDPQPNVMPTGPREYAVEYRVSSSNAQASTEYLAYINQTGGTTTLSSLVTLPATYSFKRTMGVGSGLSVSATLADASATGDLKLQILLDGKVVSESSSKGANSSGVAVYVIGQ